MAGNREGVVRILVRLALLVSSTFYVLEPVWPPDERPRAPRGRRRFRRPVASASPAAPQPPVVGEDKIGGWPSIYRYYLPLVTFWSLYNALKNLAVSLLHLNCLKSYRWLDCFILGRTYIDGRLATAGRYYSIGIDTFALVWSLTIYFLRPKFSLEPLEFISRPYRQVLGKEMAEVGAASGKWNREGPTKWTSEQVTVVHLREYKNNLSQSVRARPDCSSLGGEFSTATRPNRTAAAWKKTSHLTLRYFSLILIYIVLVAPVFYYTLFTSILSPRGFELYYSNCVDYITSKYKDVPGNGTNLPEIYEQIYSAGKPVEQLLAERRAPPFFLPVEPWPKAQSGGWYHKLRLIFDVLDSGLIWLFAGIFIIFYAWIALLLVHDLNVYMESLEHCLRSNLLHLRAIRCQPAAMLGPQEMGSWPTRPPDTAQVQDLLMDFIRLLNDYNKYVSFFTTFWVSIWLFFTALACVCALDPRGSTIVARYEIFYGELLFSIYSVTVVGSFAAIRSRTRRLYSMMATTMALDMDVLGTKIRWISLFKFFQPVPLCSFSIFGTVELSWLFIFKVSSSKGTRRAVK